MTNKEVVEQMPDFHKKQKELKSDLAKMSKDFKKKLKHCMKNGISNKKHI